MLRLSKIGLDQTREGSKLTFTEERVRHHSRILAGDCRNFVQLTPIFGLSFCLFLSLRASNELLDSLRPSSPPTTRELPLVEGEVGHLPILARL